MGGWMTCVLAAGALAACGQRGLELDVHAGTATYVQVFPIGSDACSLDSTRCAGGISRNSGAVYGSGVIHELSRDPNSKAIVASALAPVEGTDHIAKIRLDVSSDTSNVFRIVVVGYDSDSVDREAVDAAVLQNVPFKNDEESIDVYLDNPVQQWNQPPELASGPSPTGGAPIAEPCVAVADVGGAGTAPEYYVPDDDHDCDGYLVSDPARSCHDGRCECEDVVIDYAKPQMTGSVADECIAEPNAGADTTCASGTASCQDGPGMTCAFGSDTTCYPLASCDPCRDVCSDFGSADAASCYTCLQGQLESELGSSSAPAVPGACTLIFDAEGDLCVQGSAVAGATITLTLLPCTAVLGVDGLSTTSTTTFGQPVVVGPAGDLPVSPFAIPFSMLAAATNNACTITFSQAMTPQTAPVTGRADFLAKLSAHSGDELEIPFSLFISQLANGCTGSANSLCGPVISGPAYGTCAN